MEPVHSSSHSYVKVITYAGGAGVVSAFVLSRLAKWHWSQALFLSTGVALLSGIVVWIRSLTLKDHLENLVKRLEQNTLSDREILQSVEHLAQFAQTYQSERGKQQIASLFATYKDPKTQAYLYKYPLMVFELVQQSVLTLPLYSQGAWSFWKAIWMQLRCNPKDILMRLNQCEEAVARARPGYQVNVAQKAFFYEVFLE